jgi:hypothetical protein
MADAVAAHAKPTIGPLEDSLTLEMLAKLSPEELHEAPSVQYGRRRRFALAQNIVEMLAGDTEKPGDLGFGPPGGWNHILPQQSTRMARAATRITFGNMNHD